MMERERERERERENNLGQEAKIKRARYQELGHKLRDGKLEEKGELPYMGNLGFKDDRTEAEAKQENEQIRQDNQTKRQLKEEIKQLEIWCKQNLNSEGEYWEGGSINSTIPGKDPQGTNTTYYSCQGGCGAGTLVEIESVNNEKAKYIVKKDCYLKGEDEWSNNYTCANCYEKKDNNSNDTIPNSVKEYFESNNVKSIELKDNKWLIAYKDKKETKTIPVANTPSQLQPLRAYFQKKGY